jgi:hypothetical protein
MNLRSEVSHIRRFAEGTHPRGLELSLDERWRELADALERKADELPLPVYVTGLLRLLALFEDGHTGVALRNYTAGPLALRLPVTMRAFSDGLYVVETGAKVETVAGVPTERAAQQVLEILCVDNVSSAHGALGRMLGHAGVLEGLGLLSGDVGSGDLRVDDAVGRHPAV